MRAGSLCWRYVPESFKKNIQEEGMAYHVWRSTVYTHLGGKAVTDCGVEVREI